MLNIEDGFDCLKCFLDIMVFFIGIQGKILLIDIYVYSQVNLKSLDKYTFDFIS